MPSRNQCSCPLLLLFLLASACGDSEPSADAGDGGGAADASPRTDGGPQDAGAKDGEVLDAELEDGSLPVRALVGPEPAVVEAAQLVFAAFPSAQVTFSQIHGHVLSISTALPAEFEGEPEPDEFFLPEPLIVSHGFGSAGRASALVEFVERLQPVFGIDPQSLRLPVDPTNPELDENDNAVPEGPARATRLVQTHLGVQVKGRYIGGTFDAEGHLYQVTTRLLPLDTAGTSSRALSREAMYDLLIPKLPEITAGRPELRWLTDPRVTETATAAAELLFVPEGEYGRERLRLVYEVHVSMGARQALIVVDANDGEVLKALDAMPSEWHDDPRFIVTATARDEANVLVSIPSVRPDGDLYMGYGANFQSGRHFRTGQHLSISNAKGDGWLYYAPSTQPASGNTWDAVNGFTGTSLQLASAMRTTNLALEWWAARNWPSWDGRGSTLLVAVNGRSNEDGTPSFNAWGGGGTILAGGFIGPSGYTFAGDIEVMGHEFMHNVLGATSRLTYAYEPGALNEALSDLFGAALTVTPEDRFKDATMGDTFPIRSFASPPRFGQPDRYSGFVVTEGDSGGVHTNSGIMNLAHYLMIQGGGFNGVRVTAQGANKILDLVRLTDRHGRVSSEATFEEFATQVHARCVIAAVFARLRDASSTGLTEFCPAVQRAYRAVEVLPWSEQLDVAVTTVSRSGRYLQVGYVNESGGPARVEDYHVRITDELGEESYAPLVFGSPPPGRVRVGIAPESQEPGAASIVAAGGEFHLSYQLPAGFLLNDLYTLGRRLSFTLVLKGEATAVETDLLDNSASFSLLPDYMARFVRVQTNATESRVELTPEVSNAGFEGFPAGFATVLFYRASSNGPFSVLSGTGAEQVLSAFLPEAGGGFTAGIAEMPRAFVPDNPNVPFVLDPIEIDRSYVRWIGRSAGLPPHGEVWLDAQAGRPEFANRPQVYLLVNALDSHPEVSNENNLFCVNCRGGATGGQGLVVRLPSSADTDALFPAPYRAMARKLKSRPIFEPRYDVRSILLNTLPYRRY